MKQLLEAIDPFAGSLFFFADMKKIAKDHASLKAQVEQILGQTLDSGGEPHITLLYMGKGHKPETVQSVAEAAGAALGVSKTSTSPVGVATFQPGPSSEGRIPVIVKFSRDGLEDIHNRLLRATVEWNEKNQFIEYNPHMTLGYAKLPPTPRELEAISRLVPSFGTVVIDMVKLTYGGEPVASFRLGAS